VECIGERFGRGWMWLAGDVVLAQTSLCECITAAGLGKN